MKNFHLPLTDDVYARLRTESEQTQRPVTVLAREAIEDWLKARARQTRRRAIAEYATKMAGTEFDLDPALESASLEHLQQVTPEEG